MIKKVIVACCDDEVRRIVKEGLQNLIPENGIFICHSNADLYECTKYSEDTAVIFDKFFLGYVLSYQFLRLKVLNESILAYFVELGECSRYFGLRIHELGINGLIPFIERRDFERLFQDLILIRK